MVDRESSVWDALMFWSDMVAVSDRAVRGDSSYQNFLIDRWNVCLEVLSIRDWMSQKPISCEFMATKSSAGITQTTHQIGLTLIRHTGPWPDGFSRESHRFLNCPIQSVVHINRFPKQANRQTVSWWLILTVLREMQSEKGTLKTLQENSKMSQVYHSLPSSSLPGRSEFDEKWDENEQYWRKLQLIRKLLSSTPHMCNLKPSNAKDPATHTKKYSLKMLQNVTVQSQSKVEKIQQMNE